MRLWTVGALAANTSTTLSARVPREVKEELEQVDVNLSEAVRTYLVSLIEKRERLKKPEDVDREVRSRGVKAAKRTAEKLVRERRDVEPW